MVFLGRRVELHARPGYGRLEIGRWVHIGDGNSIRCHEGSLRIGDKVVFGKDNTVSNCYLDVEISRGDDRAPTGCTSRTSTCASPTSTCRSRTRGSSRHPVRIGPDCWIGTKVSVLRGTRIGHGSVLGAHAVARGEIPAYSIAVGAPARVVRNRVADYEAAAAERARPSPTWRARRPRRCSDSF